MPSYRCSLCGINYPARAKFTRCPVHNETTSYSMYRNEDEDWDWKATALMSGIDLSAKLAGTIPVTPVKVREDENGLHWISSTALIALGLQTKLQPDDVLEIPRADGADRPKHWPCDCLWEVMGYRDSTREYWVRPLRVPGETTEHPGGD